MGRIFRRRTGGNWVAEYWCPERGRHRQRSTRTKDRKVAAERLRQFERGHADPTSDAAAHSLKQAVDYLIDVACAGNAAGTVHCYTQKAGHLIRVLGAELDVSQLARPMVQDYIRQRLDEGAAPTSLHKELVVLRRSLKEAKSRGLYAEEPAAVIPPFRAKSEPKTRYLTRAEYEALLAATPPRRKLWIVVGCHAGANLSECQRLQWEHVELTSGWLWIPGQKRESRFRRVPISDELAVWLERAHQPTGPVLGRWKNSQRDLAVYCRRAGIPRVTTNDLRRTFASWLKQAGVDSRVVADLMGHTSTRMVDTVYGQLNDEVYRRAVDSVCRTGADQNGTREALMAQLAQTLDELRKLETPDIASDAGASAVPRDRVELPTRGFSVPSQPPRLRVVDGEK